jgi:hypothetical protein
MIDEIEWLQEIAFVVKKDLEGDIEKAKIEESITSTSGRWTIGASCPIIGTIEKPNSNNSINSIQRIISCD